jgi:hypothetical protein
VQKEKLDTLIDLLNKTYPPRISPTRRLVRLPVDRPIVFVGDIHGDREAVDIVLSRFAVPEHVLVFLGDLVDRGPHSLESLTAVVQAKHDSPDGIHVLMGNHEARAVAGLSPANFWDGLSQEVFPLVAGPLLNLPLAAWHPSGVLGLHGALPNLSSLDEMDSIDLGSEAWRAITWGDWAATEREAAPFRGRPAFGPRAFRERSAQLGVNILVRSHQPSAPLYLFEDRCLTLFTSTAYGGARHVAVLKPDRKVETAHDLKLLPI